MKRSFREFLNTINKSIFVGERGERNLRDMASEALIVVALGLVMFLVNVFQKDYATSLSPLAFALAGLAAFYFSRVKKCRRGSVILTSLAVFFVFTYDILFVSNGFAFLWTLLIPLPVCYMFGIREGILFSVYFELLYIAAFYTPFRRYLAGHFPEIVMNRFPFLYFFNAVITIFIMYQYHKSVLFEIEYTNRLNDEIAKQTRVANERADKLERLSENMVETLARTIDAKDKYTNGHSFRVSRYSAAIARKLGWSESEIRELRREALLHDIGKIGIPDAVLNKPERLTGQEYERIKSHTTIGHTILAGVEGMSVAASVALCHHERHDGTGYPVGIAGAEIPKHARVVSVADAYDAMQMDRIYQKARAADDILAEMAAQRGRQFDPEILDAFLDILRSGEMELPD